MVIRLWEVQDFDIWRVGVPVLMFFKQTLDIRVINMIMIMCYVEIDFIAFLNWNEFNKAVKEIYIAYWFQNECETIGKRS